MDLLRQLKSIHEGIIVNADSDTQIVAKDKVEADHEGKNPIRYGSKQDVFTTDEPVSKLHFKKVSD